MVVISDLSMEDLQEEVLTFLTCAKPGNWKKNIEKHESFDIFILRVRFSNHVDNIPPQPACPSHR